MSERLRAVWELDLAPVREYAGLHAYDGQIQDLSPDGVTRGLARLGGPPLDDPHDEAHLAAFESLQRARLSRLELHRRNPLLHLVNLELSGYDRLYAPAEERAAAKSRHLAAWPDAVDMAIESLDAVPAPVAAGLEGAVAGLTAGLDAADPAAAPALAAHARLADHVATAAAEGDPDPALGAGPLADLMGAGEVLELDLGRLAERVDRERDRLREMLADACRLLHPELPTAQTVAALLADHPDADGVLVEARALTDELLAFTTERGLVPHTDGECRVEPAPESRRWAMALMSPAAPEEDDGPSWYHVTPPHADWPAQAQQQWLSVFSRTTLPAITAHEVAPGHFTHGRSLRRAPTLVRRTLFSEAFVEGWAHYAEELCLEEGFRADDPRYEAGVALEALIRVTRLAAAIGIHTGSMSLAEAGVRFREDAHLEGPAADGEAVRATFDPTYGRYTWGKLVILDVRDRARAAWGAAYTPRRFHDRLMDLGSPPLGLVASIVDDRID